MKRSAYWIVAAFCLAISTTVMADDVSDTFAVSGLIGGVFPLSPDYVTSTADSAGLDLGGMFSFQLGPRLGFGISYENMNLGNGLRVSPIDLVLLMRFMPESRWTPTFQIGGGSAKGVNSDRLENGNFKTGIGLDYFINPKLTVGPQFNYYYISHSADAQTYLHMVGVNFAVTYFFGSLSGGH